MPWLPYSQNFFSICHIVLRLRDTALIAQKRFLPNADIYTSPIHACITFQ